MPDQGGADRLPPHSREAECSVLGSALRDNLAIDDIIPIITVDHFYLDAHQKIFRGILTLHNDHRQPVDLVTLAEHLKQQKHIEDIGGYAYLAELWDAAPTAANAVYYAKIVRQKALTRNLIHAGNEILRDAYDGTMPAEELLEQAERKVFAIAESGVQDNTSTLHQALQQAYDRIDARTGRDNRQVSGLSTGFLEMNEITAGLQNGELVVVAARPSVGKTAFALSLARNIAIDEKQPVFFVSLEQSRVELAERMMAMQSRVNSSKIRSGHLSSDDMQRLIVAGDQLGHGKFFIDDSPGQSMLRIAANARRLKRRENIRAVMIDYLQLIEPEDRRDPRHEQVAQISRRLKLLARELDVPVIALAQLNRGSEDRQDHKPRTSDLRESGSIEQDADVCMLLHRPELYDPTTEKPGVVEVIVGKQRNGPTGTIILTYLKEFMLFVDFEVDRGYSMS